MIKINHWADTHAKRLKMADVFASLDVIDREADKVDFQISAGDIWDSPIQNTGAAGFPEFISRMREIAAKAPLVMVQGTPSHDSDGSLDIFDQDENITVLKPGKAYFLDSQGICDQDEATEGEVKALIFGVPEPQKKWLIASGSDMTMDQALQALFVGYASIRSQYPGIPCILVYHGQVRGARMGKGQIAEHGVSIDDLALVGADYIAMGDIHLPQRIGETRGLHAYYPGAIHPTGDWKDSDYQFGFNQVNIGNGIVDINRIPFPHPVLTKIEGTPNEWYMTPDRKGKRVWLEITASKDQQITLDTTSILDELIAAGAVSGSKVTLKTVATETVRAGAISSMRKLRDKFNLWAENSGRTLTPSQLEKADLIEQEASGRGLTLNGGHFTFDKLILRGSKGIWKNQRKDDITFDLSALDSGIIGLVGENGKGKTTLMNNFHPWPEMPNFGSDPLYKHFRLKDSSREFFATEVTSGIKYRALIKINAQSKTCEYFLFQGDGQAWEPVPGIDGRLKSYESEVIRIFGTLEMYLRTAFMMQFPTSDHPDLSRATRSTKKSIMSALAGLDYFEVYKEISSSRSKILESQITGQLSKVEIMREGLGDIEQLSRDKHDMVKNALLYKDLLPVKLAEGKKLADEVKTLEAKVFDQANIRKEISGLAYSNIQQTEANSGDGQIISNLRSTITMRESSEKIIASYTELTARNAELIAEKTKLLESNQVISTAAQAEYKKWETAEREANYTRNQLQSSLALVNQDIARRNEELSRPVEDHCHACRQLLPQEAREHIQQSRRKVSDDIQALTAKAEGIQAEINALPAPVPAPKAPDLPAFDGRELTDVQSKLTAMDIITARKIVEESATAFVRIEELEKKIAERRANIDIAVKKIDELTATLDPGLDQTLTLKNQQLTTARQEYEALRDRALSADNSVANIQEKIDRYNESFAKIEAMKTAISVDQVELADWILLTQACGQNGIQALELDAVCPTIAAVASKLLEEYDDGRYSIRFDTTREGGKGNQIEDFLIQVIDSRDGGEQEFETLSGGECVWIRKALTDSFGIIRGQNSGIKYLTGFLDESDSALHSESRISYFRMIQSAHDQSVRRHTVMVSHSPEVQEMIETKVEVTSL